MVRAVVYLCELVGVGGLIGLVAYISWTKMALGSALSLLGAFFPELHMKREGTGEGKIDAGNIKVVFRGGLRFVVVVAGLVLIVGAVLDGHEGFQDKLLTHEREKSSLMNRLSEEYPDKLILNQLRQEQAISISEIEKTTRPYDFRALTGDGSTTGQGARHQK